jgi:hypothetical protein
MRSFYAQVDAWTRKSERRMEAVFKESTQRLIAEAQTPRGAGGKLPVDTGFLRATGQASLVGPPIGPSRQVEGAPSNDYAVVILGATIGSTIYFGWTAEYAIYMEARYGFARSAVQNWPLIVARVITEAKARIR